MTHTVSSLATKLQPTLTDYTRAAVTRRKRRVLSKENRKTNSTRVLTLIENKHDEMKIENQYQSNKA